MKAFEVTRIIVAAVFVMFAASLILYSAIKMIVQLVTL